MWLQRLRQNGRSLCCSATQLVAAVCVAHLPLSIGAAPAASGGFIDHGVTSPISHHRGLVATVDGDGRDVVVAWLMDGRGGYAVLVIDALTGKTDQVPMPFTPPGASSDSPFASLLSSRNRFYTVFGGHFVEFDVMRRAFTFARPASPLYAMGLTEDDDGVIWAVIHPQSAVIRYDPRTREYRDFGDVYRQNWRQYPRHVATDDAGWLYFGIGDASSQVIAFDPRSGKATPLLAEAERQPQQAALVIGDRNGRVFAQARRATDAPWYELHQGRRRDLAAAPKLNPKPIVAGTQALFHARFPSGRTIVSCDFTTRKLVTRDPKTKQATAVDFDYTSDGAVVMAVSRAPDGTLCGGTAFPMRFFSFNPNTGEWIRREAYHQWNTVTTQGERMFVGGYGGGFLLEWDPARPWVDTRKDAPESNPVFHTECAPDINRPLRLFAHPDGRRMILAGTPGYGYTGGGVMIWDRETKSRVLLKHEQLLPHHSTTSMVALPGNKLLCGSTTAAGTGGEIKAKQAELYVLDLATHRIEWHEPLFGGAQDYTDLYAAPRGLIYGIVDHRTFFVFDPERRRLVHQEEVASRFGPTISRQGPKVFVPGPAGAIYVLFSRGVAQVAHDTFALTLRAEAPRRIDNGGEYHDGRIYFVSGSHLCSLAVDDGRTAAAP